MDDKHQVLNRKLTDTLNQMQRSVVVNRLSPEGFSVHFGRTFAIFKHYEGIQNLDQLLVNIVDHNKVF